MIATLTATALLLLPADITWTKSVSEAKARAAEESRVIFVAVHMPGERANEHMATKVYRDSTITKLADRTVNLLAMSMEHFRAQGTRVKLGDLTEAELERLDIDLRAQILQPDAEGMVVAPQHVFLDPEGEVILSVPYGVTTEELEWCFVQALTEVDPENAPKASKSARPPKRLIKAGVIEGSDESIGAAPATLEEVRELIELINKGQKGKRNQAILRIQTADEQEARDYITKMLRGGGRRGDDLKIRNIHNIQRASPASWWEVVVEFADHNSPGVREEVAACLEALAAPDSLTSIKKVLRKEKDPRLEGMWLRAQASAGAADSKVRKATMDAAEKSKESITRANAILALGYLAPGEDVNELLGEILADAGAPPRVRTAAICAMAMTRNEAFKDLLTPYTEDDGDLKEAAEAALETLAKGDLAPLGSSVRDSCGDDVARERVFGRPRK